MFKIWTSGQVMFSVSIAPTSSNSLHFRKTFRNIYVLWNQIAATLEKKKKNSQNIVIIITLFHDLRIRKKLELNKVEAYFSFLLLSECTI